MKRTALWTLFLILALGTQCVIPATSQAADISGHDKANVPTGFSSSDLRSRDGNTGRLVDSKNGLLDLSGGPVLKGTTGLLSQYLLSDSEEEWQRKLRRVSKDRNDLLRKELRELDRRNRREQSRAQAPSGKGGGDPQPLDPVGVTESQGLRNWLTYNQDQSTIGLLESYRNSTNTALLNQAFTYDQAIAGIAFIKSGDLNRAKKIFDFYNSQWQGNGFWTVYNSQSANGAKVEWLKFLGPNAWMGIFCVQYYEATGNVDAFDLAYHIAEWARTGLNHQGGAVAQGTGQFSGFFSVEENLDYNRLAHYMFIYSKRLNPRWDDSFPDDGRFTGPFRVIFNDGQDANTAFVNYQKEFGATMGWVLGQRFADKTIRRGGGQDYTHALDTNSWSALALTPYYMDSFTSDGITDPSPIFVTNKDAIREIDRIYNATGNIFSVQSNNTFGGNLYTAKGFDFSDAINASIIGRSGMKWLEGTNQMIVAYQTMAAYYSKGLGTLSAVCGGVPSKATDYLNRANYFLSQNNPYKIWDGVRLSFPYADRANVKVWHDNPWFYTSDGSSVASSVWAYFAYNGINPYKGLVF